VIGGQYGADLARAGNSPRRARTALSRVNAWCPGRESNPHSRSRGILSPADTTIRNKLCQYNQLVMRYRLLLFPVGNCHLLRASAPQTQPTAWVKRVVQVGGLRGRPRWAIPHPQIPRNTPSGLACATAPWSSRGSLCSPMRAQNSTSCPFTAATWEWVSATVQPFSIMRATRAIWARRGTDPPARGPRSPPQAHAR
jgi:hypothetical protein